MKEFIEKLIGRLEENSFDMSLENPDCKAVWTDKAIEIVNELAEEYNNDACEWERYEEKRIFFKHCTYRNEDIDEFSISKFKFCPYCGKKIKVVK